jgi:pentatricopeptide repeat protein
MPYLQILSTSFLILMAFLSSELAASFSFRSHIQQLDRSQFRSRVAVHSTFDSRVQDLERIQQKRQLDTVSSSVPSKSRRSHTNEIANKPIGSLNIVEIKSLCNSIRHAENAYKSLNVLERILLELANPRHAKPLKPERQLVLLKPIHVFSVLTAISNDVRKSKRRTKNNSHQHSVGLDARGIEQLKNVVMLLKSLVVENNSIHCDKRCYSQDVLSFATMISSEASRYDPSGVDSAMYFLRLMQDEGGNEEWDPRLIGAVLNALAFWGRAEEAQALLECAIGVKMANADVRGSIEITSSKRLRPDQAGSCYNALLRAWSKRATILQKQSDSKSSSIVKSKAALSNGASILLHHMPNIPELSVSNQTYAAALQGYGSLGLGKESQQLLSKIEMMLRSSSYPNLSQDVYESRLDSVCYNCLLTAYCRSQETDGIVQAEKLFYSMLNQQPITHSISNNSTIDILPPRADYISYSTLLNDYSKRGLANKAEKLLRFMVSAYSLDPTAPLPTAASYLSVMRALDNAGSEDTPQRILTLIAEMERLHCENPNHKQPTRAIYISGLKCMSKHGRGIEAEQLLAKLQNQHVSSKNWTDIQAYTLVLKAWGSTDEVSREEAASRAEALLQELQTQVQAGYLNQLDVNIYNMVLNCYAKVGLVEKAEAFLADIHPNGQSFGLLIKAISNSNKTDAVDLGWKVLDDLGFNSEQFSPVFDDSIEPFNSMLRLLAKRGLAADAEMLLSFMDEMYYDRKLNWRPNIASYEAVLEALGRCNDPESATRAEALFTRMDVLSELGGSMKPSLIAYNHLINCYGNAGMSGRAERLFDRLKKSKMESVKPDQYTIGSTIKAIINGGKRQENALARVSSLVNESAGGTKNRVISAHRLKLYSKFGMGDAAEKLLRQLEDPGMIHYTTVLNAWAKSEESDAFERAETLFHEMQDIFSLDIVAYNAMMLNYSVRGQTPKAEELMKQILHHLPHSVNRKTFTMLMNTYNNDNASSKTLDVIGKSRRQRVIRILDRMRELHAAGNNDAEPDEVAYRSMIKYIRNGQVNDVPET